MKTNTKITPTMDRLIGNVGVQRIKDAHRAGLWNFRESYEDGVVRWGPGADSLLWANGNQPLATIAINAHDDEDAGLPLKGIGLFLVGKGPFEGTSVHVQAWLEMPTFWLNETDFERDVTVWGDPTLARKLLAAWIPTPARCGRGAPPALRAASPAEVSQ